MLRTRVIPVLLLKDKGLYKGVKFKNHKYVGDPINTVKIFNEKEVDEIVLLDILASKHNKEINFDLIREVATEAFMPLAYGGGIKTLDDAKKLFSIGVEKIILNTSSVTNTNFIKELVNQFGSQSIVVSLDIKKSLFGKYNLYIKSGSIKTKYEPLIFAKEMEKIGIGEILINCIDNDGVMKGYNLNLISDIVKELSIPVVTCGGARSLEDFKAAKNVGVSGVAAGSMFVYNGIHKAVLISYPKYSELIKILK